MNLYDIPELDRAHLAEAKKMLLGTFLRLSILVLFLWQGKPIAAILLVRTELKTTLLCIVNFSPFLFFPSPGEKFARIFQ